MSKPTAALLLAGCLIATAARAATEPSIPLTQGDAGAGKSKSAQCAACHGPEGNSPTPMYPKLAGQHAGYIVAQLKAYKSGERQNAIMQGMAAPLSEQDMMDVGAYYAAQEVEPGVADENLVDRGAKLYRGGDKEENIPACIACHGPSGKGIPSAGYPAIGGQHAQYTLAQLEYYASGKRQSPNETMNAIARRLSQEDMEALSSFIEGLHLREDTFAVSE